MLSPILSAVFVILASKAFALPHDNSSTPIIPFINTTILSSNGSSVTSSFQVMLYQEPKIISVDSLNSRQPSSATLSRPIRTCASRTAIFIRSRCLHEEGTTGSMQHYVTFCREAGHGGPPRERNHMGWPPTKELSIPNPTAEPGMCEQDEICMNGRTEPGMWRAPMAYCVKRIYFIEMIRGLSDAFDDGVDLADRMASVVVSKEDGKTPLAVDTLTVDSGTVGSPGQTQTCTDCIELSTPDFAPKTEFLKTEATVATTGAIAGILWLAVMSG